MSTLSIDLKSVNLHWLQAQANASGKRDLSRTLNEILDQLRASNAQEIQSVRGTIELPESDSDLTTAANEVRSLFDRSVDRTASLLASSD